MVERTVLPRAAASLRWTAAGRGRYKRTVPRATAGLQRVEKWCRLVGTGRSGRIRSECTLSSFKARFGRTPQSSVAVGFEQCWVGAFLSDSFEQCPRATGLCGVCAEKPAFLSTPQSSRSSCRVGVVRCQGLRLVFLAGTITPFVRSRVQMSLPQLRLS